MRIINIMLSRELGGIQQAFLDYGIILRSQGFDVVNVSSICAKINDFIDNDSSNIQLLNFGPWDIFSSLYLKYLIHTTGADIIIAHGNRAIKFARIAKYAALPLIGVAHNYTLTGLKKCDYVIALTRDMKTYLLQHNFQESQIYVIPNMIIMKKSFVSRVNYKNPIIIGTIARFVSKKGIDILLMSLSQLKKHQYNLKAIIGGDGTDKEKLLSLSKDLNLDSSVLFPGWIQDKDKFWDNIDIFCLPSLHEPFGIIILEAMESSLPIVSTRTEGPREIIRDKKDGLLCDAGSAYDLAKKIAYLIDNQDKARKFAESAYWRLKKNYDSKVVTLNLANFIRSLYISSRSK